MKKWITVIGLLLFCTTATIALSQEKEKIIIALSRNVVTPAEEVFMYAVPKQLGYFDDENIEVSLLFTNGSTAALQALSSGSADIAFASSFNAATAIDRGVKLKAFAGITVLWPYFIAVPENSELKSVEDLKGKRIGVISMVSASYYDLIANLHEAGLTENDVTIIPVGAGVRAAAALKAGHVDAIDGYSDGFIPMEQKGFKLHFLPQQTDTKQLFSVTMITTQEKLEKKRSALIRYARSAYKGTIYTYLYPQNALNLAFKEFPELSGMGIADDKATQNILEQLNVALEGSIPPSKGNPEDWGEWLNIPTERWNAVLGFAYKAKLTDRLIHVDEVWDNSLMPEIYNFKVDSIKEMQ